MTLSNRAISRRDRSSRVVTDLAPRLLGFPH